jgi:hypothetical protein
MAGVSAGWSAKTAWKKSAETARAELDKAMTVRSRASEASPIARSTRSQSRSQPCSLVFTHPHHPESHICSLLDGTDKPSEGEGGSTEGRDERKPITP